MEITRTQRHPSTPCRLRSLSGHRRHVSGPGFTLVELLVVLSIIALLVSILLPSLKAARDAARAVACMSNERQIGIAFANYLQEWNYTYPYARNTVSDPNQNGYPSQTNTENARTWNRALSPYLGDYEHRRHTTEGTHGLITEVLWCPMNPFTPFSNSDNNRIPTAYGMNTSDNGVQGGWKAGKRGWDAGNVGFPYMWAKGGDSGRFVPPQRESALLQPSSTLLVGEIVNGPVAEVPSGFNMGNVRTMSQDFEHDASTGELRYLQEWYTDELARYARVNHDRSWNGLRADGHVERDSKDRLIELSFYWGAANPNASYEQRMFWIGE